MTPFNGDRLAMPEHLAQLHFPTDSRSIGRPSKAQ